MQPILINPTNVSSTSVLSERSEKKISDIASTDGYDSSIHSVGLDFCALKNLLGNLSLVAAQSAKSTLKIVHDLIHNLSMPEIGWSPLEIELFILQLAVLDGNNISNASFFGEREGRIYSSLVRKHSFNFGHGIGRSGDIMALQPKAIGATLINILAQKLTQDVLRLAGYPRLEAVVLPMATGMTMSLCIQFLKHKYPNKQEVIWSRIDQKTCFKCLIVAGVTVHVLELVRNGDQLETDMIGLKELVASRGKDILCVVCTLSCFAPRTPDRLKEVAQICLASGISILVNNAYGVSDTICREEIQKSVMLWGPTNDATLIIVQSTDKNFMVPVGGAVVASPNKIVMKEFANFYPGRASLGPTLDLMITFLEMGRLQYCALLKAREELFEETKKELADIIGTGYSNVLRLMNTPRNHTSMAVEIINPSRMKLVKDSHEGCEEITQLGAKLYYRRISGCRFICQVPPEYSCFAKHNKVIGGKTFSNYGGHINSVSEVKDYFTLAVGMGAKKAETNVKKLVEIIGKQLRQQQ